MEQCGRKTTDIGGFSKVSQLRTESARRKFPQPAHSVLSRHFGTLYPAHSVLSGHFGTLYPAHSVLSCHFGTLYPAHSVLSRHFDSVRKVRLKSNLRRFLATVGNRRAPKSLICNALKTTGNRETACRTQQLLQAWDFKKFFCLSRHNLRRHDQPNKPGMMGKKTVLKVFNTVCGD
ncbi:hypothetical protein RRG08_053362 [Elysia crispata]|uniref:Uncharacterized protein n=1 Tax=Elysia crispata TaxID=231223 RepID=A0AAE0ZKP7_9GAST|nr:hypothetical protein RRG08_053362 [Elysia crispata]